MNKAWFSSRKIAFAVILFFILTPLLIYTNCGTVEDAAQTGFNGEQLPEGVHQKIFIDPSGENIPDNALKAQRNVPNLGKKNK